MVGDTNDYKYGEFIEVELKNGDKFKGIYAYHPLAGECVLNKNDFPITFKKIIGYVEK